MCSYGNKDLIELFIQNSTAFKIDLNSRDRNGRTPLHLVCERGQTKVAELLIQNSSEFNGKFNICLNTKDKNGYTPLDLAYNNKHSAIVELIKLALINHNYQETYQNLELPI